MKITLVLHNLRSVYNVGAILRTAEGLGVERVIYAGYTPRFADARLLPHLREKLNRQISKAALEKYAFSLRMEMQLTGHSVSVIRPGAVKTGLLAVSTEGLERFCQNTKLYPCNAARFRASLRWIASRCSGETNQAFRKM